MRLTKPKFWAEVSLVILMAAVVFWYIFAPPNNECQMTFMMEPPKFIRVPIDDDLSQSHRQRQDSKPKSDTTKYKLYMYSELGFPSSSDISRDLKDSMPVLFIPGNAGSYQQVRSLASTCIRQQLTSLKAFKFIFYTVDFRGQLSGLSGDLIEEQIRYVDKCLKQITRLHTTSTGGVIVVGHSVGGLIAKALFAVPNFDTKSVPLIINLASPLTRPLLNFDSKTLAIYERTHNFWSKKPSDFKTVSISISGGRPDRLVPMHLTRDTDYDFSLTTSSINGVWLETDHVCITWCKELVHKISSLLSAIMDKTQTMLIQDKRKVLSIVKKELLSRPERPTILNQAETLSNREAFDDTTEIIEVRDSLSIPRTRLSSGSVLLNFTQTLVQSFMIVVEHIEPLRGKELYGCKSVIRQTNSTRLQCVEKVDLTAITKPIPSRRFEPKRTAMKLTTEPSNFLILDFSSDRNRAHKIPEVVIVTPIEADKSQLSMPALSSVIFSKFVPSRDSELAVIPKSFSYNRYELINYNALNRFLILRIKLEQCPDRNSEPKLILALLYQQNYLNRAFHILPTDSKDTELVIRFSTAQALIISDSKEENDIVLELFTDGTCANKIRFEVDYLDYAFGFLQVNLSSVLQVACLMITILVYVNTKSIVKKKQLFLQEIALEGVRLLVFVIPLKLQQVDIPSKLSSLRTQQGATEVCIFIITLSVLSLGVIALLGHLLNCTIDLAIILNRVQTNFYKIIARTSATPPSNIQNGNSNGLAKSKYILDRNGRTLDFDWVLVGMALIIGITFSNIFIDICSIIFLIKFAVHINSLRTHNQERGKNLKEMTANEAILQCETIHNWAISMGVLCTISMLSAIPSILLRFNEINGGNSLHEVMTNFSSVTNCVYALASLVMIKLSKQQIILGLNVSAHEKQTLEWRNKIYQTLIKVISLWHAININDCFSTSANLLLLFAATSSYQYLSRLDLTAINKEKLN